MTAGVAAAAVMAGAVAVPSTALAPDGVHLPARAAVPAVRVAPPRSFTVAAVGDFLPEPLINRPAAAAAPPGVRYDYAALLRPIQSFVEFADLAICHMETPIGPPGATVGWVGRSAYGTNLLQAAWETPFDLRRIGFDRCSTASNHSNDLGLGGIADTLTALDAAGLSHNGTARTTAEASVRTFLVKGVRVAHLSYARNSNTGFPSDWWRLSRAIQTTQVRADVATARQRGAEVVIVSLHVYMEMQTGPIAEDRGIVDSITSATAKPDLIVIHGPHVPQPMERVNGVVTYWSVGNFISGMGAPNRGKYADPRTLDGLMPIVRFTRRANGTWAVDPFTVLLCNTPVDRKVYPGLTTLKDPAISSTLRTQLQACVARTTRVVSGLR